MNEREVKLWASSSPQYVYAVLIGGFTPMADIKLGAIYRSERAAQREADRLKEANRWTKAWVVERELG